MRLGQKFAALSDPTRRTLLARLEDGEKTLTELADPLPMTLMAVQKHVKVLQDAGLVTTRKLGRSRYVRLHAKGLSEATSWIDETQARWNSAFDRLAKALGE